jgi:hypothetical protein
MTCEQGQCTFICAAVGESCFPVQGAEVDPFVPCCDGLTCNANNVCEAAGPTCAALGETCADASDCCEGTAACETVCCLPDTLFCNSDDECCGNATCELNVCVSPCAEEGEDCAGGSGSGLDCCGNLICKHAAGEAGVCVSICGEAGDACEELLDCCAPDFVCNTDTNQCEAAAAATCETDGDCDAVEVCCPTKGDSVCTVGECCGAFDDFHCDEDEVCTAALVCEAAAPTCSVDADCNIAPTGGDDDDDDGGGAICCGGFCISGIECCIDSENPNERCDEGEHCFEGVCVFACKGDADCDKDTCCCPDGTCSSSCCKDDDTGGVDQLPSTGVGGDQGLSGLLGAGILAAGAAYLAGKKLRPNEAPAGEE